MPPKAKFKREDIEAIAFDHVRQYGWETLSTRHIAQKLGSTTRPIYSHFSSMAELKTAVMKKVLDLYHAYQSAQRSDDAFLNMGLGIIAFAQKEPNLFKFMYNAQNMQIKKNYDEEFFHKTLKKLKDHPRLKKFSEEMRKEFMFTMYIFTMGLTALIESGWTNSWKQEDIVSVLHSAGLTQYYGYLEKVRQIQQGSSTDESAFADKAEKK
ncbi:MAG: TetR family transcriptional regulator [Proteobacteria bacterium]|nr:TetR family transcriptional regulator [Pseudomonadota bacterium]MBU1581486.1 TetR family transcriptional regulator [Pseudomonadota bacterium]MBU2455166.1 TetR family transcriptional regulator [Pseudomonadota bacterium]MBU2627246.1 TetR family transcriptional regulator [Pseudomonadota bacterium]